MKKSNQYFTSIMTKILFVGLSFVNSILINRYLSPSLKGEYAYIINISSIIAIIIGFNITSSLPFFIKKHGYMVKNKITNIVYTQLVIYIFLSIIIFFLFKSLEIFYIVIASILVQFSNQLDFFSIVLDINKRNKIVLISSLLYTTILILFFFLTEQSLAIVLCLFLVFNVIKSLFFIFDNKIIPEKSVHIITTSEVVKFSFYPMIASLLTTFNYNIDIIILKSFVDIKQIGIYSVAVTLAGMLWVIPDAFKEVLVNKITNTDSTEQIVLSIKFNLYFSIIIILGFTFLGERFINLFYGKEYIDSYGVTTILFIGTIPMIFFKMVNTLYLAIGRQKFSFIILTISVFCNVILNYLTIPVFGIKGAAMSSIISYFISGIIMLFSFMKLYKISLSSFFIITKSDLKIIKKIF